MNILLLRSPALSGIENMIIDEYLLEETRRLDTPILRFYSWKEPTLSLGYFQCYEDRVRHAPSRDIPVVRRLTGGGAIVHDRETTYSLAVPPGHSLSTRHRLKLYETVHRTVIGVLSNWEIDAFLVADVEEISENARDKDRFLCFERLAPGDVVIREDDGWIKILGSAQYRDRHGAVLQHGSLLWDRSPAAPELPGLRKKFAGRPIGDRGAFVREWIDRIIRIEGWKILDHPEGIDANCLAHLRKKRYAEAWIKKK